MWQKKNANAMQITELKYVEIYLQELTTCLKTLISQWNSARVSYLYQLGLPGLPGRP